ncbi:MAG: TraX family protein [Oscillospiraceae bacterium]
MPTPLIGTRPVRGLSAGALKWLAIAAMVVDHAAYAFLPDYWGFPALALHMLGRITGPVMFFFIAEGYHHTHNKNRYTLRLALFAVLSYIPFVCFKTGALPGAENWMSMNVIYTLLCAHLALRARHEIAHPALRIVALALCLFASLIGDWGWMAVVFVLVFDVFRGNFKNQALGYTLVTLTQLLPALATGVLRVLSGAALGAAWPYFGQTLYYAAFFVPLALLRFYNGQRGASPKYFFYAFYPLHLLVIVAVRQWLAQGP